jgi:hypothetical protein
MAIEEAPLRYGLALVRSGTERMNGRSITSHRRLCEQAFDVKLASLPARAELLGSRDQIGGLQ